MGMDPDTERFWLALWRDNRADVAAVGLVVGIITALVLGWSVTPFHYVDALVLIATALGPALLVLACFSGLAGRVGDALGRGEPMQVLNLSAGLVLVGVCCPGNLLLWANQRFDTSPATSETVPVVETWSRTSRSRTTYLAGVTTAVASPLGARSFYGSQPVAVPRARWQQLVPGQSRLVLREHRGALRVPWFEPEPHLAD